MAGCYLVVRPIGRLTNEVGVFAKAWPAMSVREVMYSMFDEYAVLIDRDGEEHVAEAAAIVVAPDDETAGSGDELSLVPGPDAPTDSLTLFMREVGRHPLLSAAQEVELAKRIERGDSRAKEQMINANLRLVIHNARRYTGRGVPLGDLIQEGVIGLNRAVEKFDWRKGFKFSTYATWWIRQACQRAVANHSGTIRIPTHVVERRTKLARARQRLELSLGREPTVEELAAAAGLTLEHTAEALGAAAVSVSLNQQVGENGLELGDLFADTDSDVPEELVADDERRQAVRAAVERLPVQQQQVVRLRFGLEGEPKAVETVARELGIGRDHVRRLEAEALGSLAGMLSQLADDEDLAASA